MTTEVIVKRLHVVLVILAGLLSPTYVFAQPASVTWALNSTTLLASVSSGNGGGQSEAIGAGGSPSMVIFDYNAHGQRLWVGTAGWTVLPGEDPLRFVQFAAAPTSGNSLNITNVTFNHADFQTSVNFSKRASCYC